MIRNLKNHLLVYRISPQFWGIMIYANPQKNPIFSFVRAGRYGYKLRWWK